MKTWGHPWTVIFFISLTWILLASGCQKSISFVNPTKTYPVDFGGMKGEVDSFLFHSLAFNIPFRTPAVITPSWSRVLTTTSAASGSIEKVQLTTIPFVILLTDPDQWLKDSQGQHLSAANAIGKWVTDFDGLVTLQQNTAIPQLGVIEWSAAIDDKAPLLKSLKIGTAEIDLSLGTIILIDSGAGAGSATGMRIRQRQWKNSFDLQKLTDLHNFNRQHQVVVPEILKELGY